ncbi:hypothetical protein HYY74_02430 [Candidatus Woesearchaeota archaeon]|nr:hypothetical protein [Candidatus Woesearchaeota archaeon]
MHFVAAAGIGGSSEFYRLLWKEGEVSWLRRVDLPLANALYWNLVAGNTDLTAAERDGSWVLAGRRVPFEIEGALRDDGTVAVNVNPGIVLPRLAISRMAMAYGLSNVHIFNPKPGAADQSVRFSGVAPSGNSSFRLVKEISSLVG